MRDYCLNLFAGTEPLQFSQYFFGIEASETEFYIIANCGTAGYLIPEMGYIDYFMLIKNHFDKAELEAIILKLKCINNIESVLPLDPKTIRSNENLLF